MIEPVYRILLTGLVVMGCAHQSLGESVVVDSVKGSASQDTVDTAAEEPSEQVNPDALRYFMDGQMYMSQGDYARAIIEFQDALALDPDVSAIHVSMAECYWRLGKMKRSFSHLLQAVRIDSTDTEAREMLAQQFLMQRRFDKAVEQYEVLTALEPDNYKWFYALADLAKLQQQFDKAIDLYQKTFAVNPEAVSALESAAELALNQHQLEQAAELYRQLIEVDNRNVQYLRTYANVVTLLGNYREAIGALERIQATGGATAGLLSRIGALYFEAGVVDSAVLFLEQAFAEDSTSLMLLHYLSSAYREQELYDQADHMARALIRNYPDDPQGYIDAALVALSKDAYSEAIVILSEPADRFPDEFAIQFLLGTSYNLDNNQDLAQVYLERAVKIQPGARNAWHALAIIYDRQQLWDQSDEVYDRLIQEDSTDAQAYNNYAYSLAERGEKLTFALEMAQKAVQIAPDNSAYLDTIGWIYFKLGDLEQALKYIKQSVEIEADNAVVLEHLGDVLVKANRTEEAKVYYQKALELDQDNERLKTKVAEQ
jgi:tetratricopeptide (TPR) repeat protein